MARKKRTKEKKDELKPKVAKPKGPIDVERQCGVMLPHGQPCGRSLCCKRHSMNAKRAVPGRSLPYDMLPATYREKNFLLRISLRAQAGRSVASASSRRATITRVLLHPLKVILVS